MKQFFIGHKLHVIQEEKLVDHEYLHTPTIASYVCLNIDTIVMNNVNYLDRAYPNLILKDDVETEFCKKFKIQN